MQEEQPRRKARVPLTAEELFYVKQIKHLKEVKRIQDFKKTSFYKLFNSINIFLAAFLTYCLLSIFIGCYWREDAIERVETRHGDYNADEKGRPVTEMEITTKSGLIIPVKTSELYQEPERGNIIFIGRDVLFHKIIKVKLLYDERSFWHRNTYAVFAVIIFAMLMVIFIYGVNKHLTMNGLLTAFGLFTLAGLYFVLI